MRGLLLKYGLPAALVLIGFALMMLLLGQRRPPEPVERETPGILVEVLEALPTDYRVRVQATGIVQPEREAVTAPQVGGRVVELGENFVPGGFVRAGELLLRIDPADYELALRRAEATVRRAEVQLATTIGKAEVARLEWEQFSAADENAALPSPLALYQPQLDEAEAELAAAKADLATARLNLERTALYAPFNARVRERQVAIGQFVPPGGQVARLTGTDTAEVVVPVPLRDLPWLSIPGPGRAETDKGTDLKSVPDHEGSPAMLTVTIDGRDYRHRGRVLRTLGEVESHGRMVQVVVGIDDPYGLSTPAAIELLPGLFAKIEIAGRQLRQIFILPRRALREGDTVWLADADLRLVVRPVTVARREREVVLIEQGLTPGELVVLTDLVGAAPGMRLRLNNQQNQGAQ